MVRHVILWQLKDELDSEKKESVKAGIKAALEALVGTVPGLREVHVQTAALAGATADVMLDCLLDDEAALRGYAVHPAHVQAADTYVRPFTKLRVCMDYEVR